MRAPGRYPRRQGALDPYAAAGQLMLLLCIRPAHQRCLSASAIQWVYAATDHTLPPQAGVIQGVWQQQGGRALLRLPWL